jgi:hypothetical protein
MTRAGTTGAGDAEGVGEAGTSGTALATGGAAAADGATDGGAAVGLPEQAPSSRLHKLNPARTPRQLSTAAR